MPSAARRRLRLAKASAQRPRSSLWVCVANIGGRHCLRPLLVPKGCLGKSASRIHAVKCRRQPDDSIQLRNTKLSLRIFLVPRVILQCGVRKSSAKYIDVEVYSRCLRKKQCFLIASCQSMHRHATPIFQLACCPPPPPKSKLEERALVQRNGKHCFFRRPGTTPKQTISTLNWG